MNRIDIFIGDVQAGSITHTPDSGRYAFSYTAQWLQTEQAFAISPLLPLQPPAQTAEAHSTTVRLFFENLLPEGRALDEAAAASQVANSNLIGLMLAIGRETAGALRLGRGQAAGAGAARLLPPGELSTRIRARPQEPFSVWDGRVRLSIAGYQDKLAVFKNDGHWYLPDGPAMASTVILKPEPPPGGFGGLVSNEFFCMRLARDAGLPAATVRLVHVPEPVLEIDRFDRRAEAQGVTRLHIIDGCQALGLAAALKYERTYGNSADVRHIRDGASLPALFRLLERSRQPAPQRLQLLRWVIFQVLIGNNDAHAKNISLFCDQHGLALTPCYDLVSTLAFAGTRLDNNFAMALGDAFTVQELTPFEWAHFAHACGLKPRLVANELKKMLARMAAALDAARAGALSDGADMTIVDAVQDVVAKQCERQAGMPGALLDVDPALF